MDFLNFIRNNKLVILIVSVVLNVLLVIFGITFIFNYESDCVCEEKVILTENVVEKENSNDFYVEIKGAVKTPGVYLVNSNNIINDVVKLAGGFSKSAYTKNINLSRKVTSELVIYVFTQSEYKKNNKKLEQTVCDCSGYDISNCTNNSASEILSSDKDTNFEAFGEMVTTVGYANDRQYMYLAKGLEETDEFVWLTKEETLEYIKKGIIKDGRVLGIILKYLI